MAPRKIVILNQAVNYLTIGFANAFSEKSDEVVLITGSIHTQGETLKSNVKVRYINKWHERPARKKMLSYLIAMFRMWWLLMTKYRKHEVFFVSVPPMGYLLNVFLPHKFSMVIWDVYPDVFKITGMNEQHVVYRLWSWFNKKSFRKAHKVFTISERMADLLEVYMDRKKIIVQPIWSIFQQNEKCAKEENPFIMEHKLQGKFIVQYSGNIGLTHNVESMIDLAEAMSDVPDVLFQIIGRGPRKPILEKLVEDKKLPNTMFLPFQSDEMFPYSLSSADLGIVILDETTSKGSVPSKSFNLMSYGIPSLYIASDDSQLKVYAEKYNHAFCCTKDNLQTAKDYILKLKSNHDFYADVSNNALLASKDFKRENADFFVAKYFS